jgi:predicted secreted protein
LYLAQATEELAGCHMNEELQNVVSAKQYMKLTSISITQTPVVTLKLEDVFRAVYVRNYEAKLIRPEQFQLQVQHGCELDASTPGLHQQRLWLYTAVQ